MARASPSVDGMEADATESTGLLDMSWQMVEEEDAHNYGYGSVTGGDILRMSAATDGRWLLSLARVCFFVASWSLFSFSTITSADYQLWLEMQGDSPREVAERVDGLQLVTLLMTMLGALFGGIAIDLKGWYPVVMFAMSLTGIGSLWTAVAFPVARDCGMMQVHMMCCRAIIGFGAGMVYPCAAVLTLKSYPPSQRHPRALAVTFLMQCVACVGAVLCSTVVLVFLKPSGKLDEHDVRNHVVAVTLLSLLGVLVGGWLAYQTRRRFGAMYNYSSHKQARPLLPAHALNHDDGPGSSQDQTQERSLHTLWAILRQHRTQLFGAAIPWMIFDGFFYGQSTFTALLHWDSGLDPTAPLEDESHRLAYAFSAAPGYILAVYLISKVDRCCLQMYGFVALAVLFAASSVHLSVHDHSKARHALEVVFMVLIYLFINTGPNTTTFVISADMAPAAAAGSFFGAAAAIGKLGASLGFAAFHYSEVISNEAYTAETHGVAAALCLIGALCSWLFVFRPSLSAWMPQSPGITEAPVSDADTIKIAAALENSDFFIPFDNLRRYERIAAGGQGQVFRGQFGSQPVVLKEIFDTLIANDTDAFEREAQTWVKIQHPGVVRFFGVSIDDSKRMERSFYLVAAFCEGGTVKDAVLRRRGHLNLYMRWASTICDTMEFLHARGVAHRDIKPSNILLDSTDLARANPIICDLGVAKILEHGAKTMTNTFVGTPQFLPAELFVSELERVDATKVDVYAAGVTFFFMFCGFMPWEENGPLKHFGAVIAKVTAGELPPMNKVDSRIRDEIVYPMMSSQPDRRPTFGPMARAIEQLRVCLFPETPTAQPSTATHE